MLYFMFTLCLGYFLSELRLFISSKVIRTDEPIIPTCVSTMPAKSLGTLVMIYAIVELQNPLPRKTMLWKADRNVSASTSDTFLQS